MFGVTAGTNIYVSGIVYGGMPRRFLDFAASGDFNLHLSIELLNEVLRVLGEKFRWDAERLAEVEEDIRSYTRQVTPTRRVDIIKADPSDNRLLECAVAARSDFIVSGDKRHVLPVGSYQGIRIVSVAEFLQLLKNVNK